MLLSSQSKASEAEAKCRAALAIQEGLAADFPAIPGYRDDLAGSRNNLGLLLVGMGKATEAEAEYRGAIAIWERLVADYPAVPGLPHGKRTVS